MRIVLALAFVSFVGCGDDSGSGGDASVPQDLAVPDLAAADDLANAVDLSGDASLAGDGASCSGPSCASEAQDCTVLPCVSGFACVTKAAGVAICQRLCGSDGVCTTPGGLCTVPVSAAMACSVNCNPVSNAGCVAAGTSCQILLESAGAMRFFTDCEAAGGGGQGVTCNPTGHDCAVGYTCINNGVSNLCVKYCRYPGNTDCGALTCTRLGSMPTIGGQEYAVCN